MTEINIYARLEKRIQARQDARELAESLGFELRDLKYLTKHPDDEYLFSVLCYDAKKDEHIAYLYNSEYKGFTNGNYYKDFKTAYERFNTRQ